MDGSLRKVGLIWKTYRFGGGEVMRRDECG